MVDPAPDARSERAGKIYEELCRDLRGVTRAWQTPLSGDERQWDPYVRTILLTVAFEFTHLEEEVESIYPRLWRQIGERLCPEIFLPQPAQVVVRFSKTRTLGTIPRGRPLTAHRKTGPGSHDFMTNWDVKVFPAEWQGGVIEGSTAYLCLGIDQVDSYAALFGRDPVEPLTLWVNSDRTDLGDGLVRIFADTKVACYDGTRFTECDRPRHASRAGRVVFTDRRLSPFGYDGCFFDIQRLESWRRGGWRGEREGFWLRLDFPGIDARDVISDPTDPPFELNCCTASNVRRHHVTVDVPAQSVGYARLGPLPSHEIVALERVTVGNQEFVPFHEAARDKTEVYVLDQAIDEASGETVRNLLLFSLPLQRLAEFGRKADVTLFTTEPGLSPRFAAGDLTEMFNLHGANTVGVNRTVPTQGRPAVADRRKVLNGIAHILRTGDRLITIRDYRDCLWRIDPRVTSVKTMPVIRPDLSGSLNQILELEVEVDLQGRARSWETDMLASYYREMLQERAFAGTTISVSCKSHPVAGTGR